jgi:hypothetical protein
MAGSNKIKICFIHSNPFGAYDLNAGPIVHMTGFAEGIKEAGGDIFFISPNFVPLYKNITRVVIVRFDKIFQSFLLNRLLYTAKLLFHGAQIIKHERPTVLYERYGYSNIVGVIRWGFIPPSKIWGNIIILRFSLKGLFCARRRM